MRTPRIILPALALLSLCGISHAQETPKLPFTLSKETTAITSPLNPDGTVDYITAVNQRWGKDIKPEENAFVGLLEAVGTDENIIPPTIKEKLLQMSGAKDVGKIAWRSYEDFLKSKNIDWNHQDSLLLAEYNAQSEAFLKRITSAFSRPKYWCPHLPEDGRSLYSVYLPGLGLMRSLSTTLCADATRRAASGDFPGSLSEISALKNLAHHLRSQPTLIENLLGIAINNSVDQCIGSVAGSGKLSLPEMARLADMLRQLPPTPEITVAIETERWFSLDWIALFAHEDFKPLGLADIPIGAPYATLDIHSIDWNTILKRANVLYDAEIDALHQPTPALVTEKSTLPSLGIQPHNNSSLHRQPDEPFPAYTARVGDVLLADVPPSWKNAQQSWLASRMCDQMTTAIIAAARYHAEKGKWPDSLTDLLPLYLTEIPRDTWSESGTDAVKYSHTPSAARLYSVGRNHIDDAGIHDPTTQRDDLIIGPQ